MAPLSDDLIARFRGDYERLLTSAEAPDHRIALAVSGGPDSMAMLGLAAAAFPGRMIAATVDHGLRAESTEEAAMVARTCEQIGIAHTTLKIAVPKDATGNLHGWARQERYALLKRWAIAGEAPVLCTAHHAEDQAETFLMRAARATGLSGLSAVRARKEDTVGLSIENRRPDGFTVRYGAVIILRPLLRWRRRELRATAETLRLAFVDDPSNRDPRFDRARFRAWLEEAPWIDPIQIGKTAENLAALNADLIEISHWLWETRGLAHEDFAARVDVAGLPRGVKRYFVRMGIDHVHMQLGIQTENWSPASNVEASLDALEGGKAVTQADVLVSVNGNIWHFRAAPPRRPH